MAGRTPIPLTPFSVELGAPEFSEISGWPFDEPYVGRLLTKDIPQRMRFKRCRTWVYLDPAIRLVGFGTLDVCDEYRLYTEGQPHPYIPLLAVNPTSQRLGHGTSIVDHLVAEATILVQHQRGIHDALFLDVYTDNEAAIQLYARSGFETITTEPIPDRNENDRPYIIMARRVSVGRAIQT